MTEIIVTSSALILFLIIIRKLLQGKISPTVQYALWLLVAARLLIPGTLFTAPVSLMGVVGDIDPIAQTGSAIQSVVDWGTDIPLAYAEDYRETYQNTEVAKDALTPTWSEDTTLYGKIHGTTESADYVLTGDWTSALRFWFGYLWRIGIVAVALILLLSNLAFYVNLRKRRQLLSSDELPRPCLIRVYVIPGLISPCLFGLARPAIYLNEEALAAEGLEHILTHEETHYCHGDHIWAILRSLCLAVHWYNPLVWWAAILSRRDCELSCDAGAIRRLGEENRISYGETLLSMIVPGRRTGDLLRTATTMTAEKRTMAERITLIAKRPKMLKITLAAMVLMTCGAAVFFFGGGAKAPPQEDASNDVPTITLPDVSLDTGQDSTPPPLTEERAIAIYSKAREIWNWFEFGTLPTTDTVLQTEEGTMLQVSNFDSIEELRLHLEKYFSPNWAEHLLTDYTLFRESDDKLFVLPANRGSNIYAGKETVTAFLSNAVSYDCHIHATTEVLDFYEPETVLYQKHHDWYILWNGENYVFTSFGPSDDVDPQKYYNALTILDHYNRDNTITTWFPVLASLDWNALYATRDLWPKGFDLGMYILTSLSERVAAEDSLTPAEMDHILSATEGLDGAYAEQYQFIVYELYQKAPSAFAYAVLESLEGPYQTQAIDYLRYGEQYHRAPSAEDSAPMTQEETFALLRQVMYDTLSATPSSMHFDQPGQQEQFLPVNAYGISAATYTSSDPSVATVDDEGFVTSVSPGKATITLHYEGAAGQKDLSCSVSCNWVEYPAETETEALQQPTYTDGEAINGAMRGYTPLVWEQGSPQDISITLSGDWTMDGIRAALFDAVSARIFGTLLENDLTQIELSPQFQFPESMADGVVMEVPFYAHYQREEITLPSGSTYVPAVRSQEITAQVTLVGSGTTAPVDDDFAQKQLDYQLLEACVPIQGGIQVSASAEDFDVVAHIRDTVIANLDSAGLSNRYYLAAISTGSYKNPVWTDPGYEQAIVYEVTFASSDSSGIDAVAMSGEVLLITVE